MAQPAIHRKRELAAQVLYGLSFGQASDIEALKNAFRRSPRHSAETNEPQGFAWDLACGVWKNEKSLDSEIGQFARNWRPDQIGRLELVLLRLALYEMRHVGTPPKVVISEYLDLAGEFGALSAKSFINGILNAAARANPETAALIGAHKEKE